MIFLQHVEICSTKYDFLKKESSQEVFSNLNPQNPHISYKFIYLKSPRKSDDPFKFLKYFSRDICKIKQKEIKFNIITKNTFKIKNELRINVF